MKTFDVDYWVEREGEIIQEGYLTVKLSDKKLKEIVEFISNDHFSGELIDIPGNIYDSIEENIVNEAVRDMRRDKKDVLLESDDLYYMSCLPVSLLKLLPQELVEKIDKTLIFDYYQVDSMEALWQWYDENYTEEDEAEDKEETISMKCLAIRQPWAQLIVTGIKDIECRDAMPAPKKPKVFIAASGTKLKWEELGEDVQKIYTEYEKKGVLPPYKDLPTKCIVGYVDIVKASFDPVESPWGCDWEGMKYTLRNAMQLDEPIYGKNKATPYFYM